MQKSQLYPAIYPTAKILASILTPERVGQTGVLLPKHPRAGVGMNRVVFPDAQYEYFGNQEIEINQDIAQPCPAHGIEMN